MNSTHDKIEFVNNPEELNNLKPEWENLYEESDASPYLSHEWVASALHYFPPTGGFFLAVVRDEIGLKAIVPLEIGHEKFGPLPVRVLRFAVEGWALRNGPLLASRAKGKELVIIAEAIDVLTNKGVGWDYCRLMLMPAAAVSSIIEKHPFWPGNVSAAECYIVGSSIVIEIGKSTENFFKQLGSKKRDNIKRRTKLLQQKGVLRMVRSGLPPLSNTEELDRLVEDALTISGRSWQGKATVGRAISDHDVRDFFREVCHLLAAKGLLDLSILYVSDRAVSYYWGPARRPCEYITKIGYDPAFSQCSPGTVHLAKLIEYSFAQGIREIDLGHEFPEYKRFWGTREDDLYNVFLYPHGMKPGIIRLVRSLKRKMARSRQGGD